METLEERIKRVTREDVYIVPYNPVWPRLFEEEKKHLFRCIPNEFIGRIEHFGSTSVPGLAAKPVVDMLVEVTCLEKARLFIAPILEDQGYDYFWRPTRGDDGGPFYAWFIKRDRSGKRTHHIHMVEKDFEHWEGLLFRDYLIEHPDVAKEYEMLKYRLAAEYPNDREAYTNAKGDLISRVTAAAKRLCEPV